LDIPPAIPPRILIVSSGDDGTATFIASKLSPDEYVFADTSCLRVVIRPSAAYLLQGETAFDVSEFETVWLRHTHPQSDLFQFPPADPGEPLPATLHKHAQAVATNLFADQQAAQVVVSLLRYCKPEARVISPLASYLKANDKVFQLEAARRAGFRVPETIVTNVGEEVVRFHAGLGRRPIISKFYDPLNLWADPQRTSSICMSLQTFEISVEVEHLSGQILPLPRIWQPKIVGLLDARLTVVEDKVFGCYFWPKSGKRPDLPDFRYYYADMQYEAMPAAAIDKHRPALVQLNDELGLKYSSCDFYFDPHDGSLLFLEANSVGHCLWPRDYLGDDVYPAVSVLVNCLRGNNVE
jgi:hypothetical protein